MLLVILVGVCAILVYYGLIEPHRYWKTRQTIHEKPWPLFGNLLPIVLRKTSMAELIQGFYNNHRNKRYVGIYQFLIPTLILRDPDLIKLVAVKAFDKFPEHSMVSSEENDPIWALNLFAMPGGLRWKEVRTIISPVFTTSKLKGMFSLVTECAKQLVEHLGTQKDEVAMDMLDTFTRVTNDIIASTAFGVSCNSLKHPENKVFMMSKEVSNFGGLKSLKFFVASISTFLMKLLKIRFVDEYSTEFFRKVIKESIRVRHEDGVVRPDLVHLMMEARKAQRSGCTGNGSANLLHAVDQEANYESTKKMWTTNITDDLITAQAVVFFMAGYDTTSRALSFTAYELALNPDIQKRLQKDIDEVVEQCNGKITYELVMSMKYLDMVVSEALRKWPPFAVTDRRLVGSLTIEAKEPDENALHLEGRMVMQFPIYAIHRDPDIYPNPETFDPERFSDENKHKINPYTYLPFGIGPRNCIAQRFALLEIKTVMLYLLSQFEVLPVAKTQIPLELSKSNVNPVPEGGFWLALKKRKELMSESLQ